MEISGEEMPTSQDRQALTKQEIAGYLLIPLLGKEDNVIDWWRGNANVFPNLAFLARRWLTIPASSIDSERLFSTSGLVANDSRRSKLLPENVEMLIFLNKNL